MKSIFVLEKYGLVSMVVLKKLFEANISYLKLEFFKEDVLKQEKINKKYYGDIMKSLELAQDDIDKNVLSELSLYGLSRTYLSLLKDKNVLFQEIDSLTVDQLIEKYSIKEKVWIEVLNAYNLLKQNNFNIPMESNYSDYVLKFLKNDAFCSFSYDKLKEELGKTTYPLDFLDSDLVLLLKKGVVFKDNDNYKYVLPSLLDKAREIKRLDERNLDILNLRLSGLTLNEIGQKYDLSRERIRQIIENIYSKIPSVKEDNYKNIYEKYDLSLDEFKTIFEESTETYYYLFDRYEHGIKDVPEMLNEPFVDKKMEERIKSLYNIIVIDGEDFVKDKIGIVKYYLKNKCDGEILVDDLFNQVNDFITVNFNDSIDLFDSIHNLEAVLERKEWCISGKNRKYRYYEINLLTIGDVKRLSNLLDGEFGLYSTLYFFENNKDLMEEIDIRNEQELHNLIRNVIKKDNLIIQRMPNILIGYSNKNDFFIDKFNELSPISVDDFLKNMKDNFGHREDTLQAYLSLELSKYVTNGMINTTILDLTSDEINIIKKNLIKEVYTLNEFWGLCDNLGFVNVSRIVNNMNLSKVGYKLFSSFVIKDCYKSLEDAFYDLVKLGKFDNTLIGYNSTSYATITRLEKNKKIIKINEKYYLYEDVKNFGIKEDDIKKLENLIVEVFSKDEFFTIKNVREKIHGVFDNIDDNIVVDIIKSLDVIRKISWHGNSIFVLDNNLRSRKKFMLDIIHKNEGKTIEELATLLRNKYGLNFNLEQIKLIINDKVK